MSDIHLRISKSYARNAVEVYAFKYSGSDTYQMIEGEWVKVNPTHELSRPILRLPFNTEVTIGDNSPESHNLLEQKDKDKTCHIDNLNTILNQLLLRIPEC